MKKVFFILCCIVVLIEISFTPVLALESTSKWNAIQPEINKTSNHILEGELEKKEKVLDNGDKYLDYILTYIIPEDYEEDIIRIVPDAYLKNGALPGVNDSFKIIIQNLSPNIYQYIDNSFVLSTEDFSMYSEDELGKELDNVIGFNQVPLREDISFYRCKNTALQGLYGVKSSSKLTNEMLKDENISERLKDLGYEGIEELSIYYLDFYNRKYNLSSEKLEDFPDSVIFELLDGDYTRSVRESSKEVLELAFNYLYNKLFAFTYDLNQLTTLNSEHYSLGSYMRKESIYNIANQKFIEAFSNVTPNTIQSIKMPHVYINNQYMANTYLNYNISFYLEFSLKKQTERTVSNLDTSSTELIIDNNSKNSSSREVLPPNTNSKKKDNHLLLFIAFLGFTYLALPWKKKNKTIEKSSTS